MFKELIKSFKSLHHAVLDLQSQTPSGSRARNDA